MRGHLRVALAVALSLGSVWTAQLSAPAGARACSCRMVEPDAIGEFRDDPGVIVFSGIVTQLGNRQGQNAHTFGDIAVERLYHGSIPGRVIRVKGGDGADCGLMLELGQRVVTAARFENALLTPSGCSPHGDPFTPEGMELIAIAERAYGLGNLLEPPPEGEAPETAALPAPGVALPVVLGGAVSLALVLFGGIAILARGRRQA